MAQCKDDLRYILITMCMVYMLACMFFSSWIERREAYRPTDPQPSSQDWHSFVVSEDSASLPYPDGRKVILPTSISLGCSFMLCLIVIYIVQGVVTPMPHLCEQAMAKEGLVGETAVVSCGTEAAELQHGREYSEATYFDVSGGWEVWWHERVFFEFDGDMFWFAPIAGCDGVTGNIYAVCGVSSRNEPHTIYSALTSCTASSQFIPNTTTTIRRLEASSTYPLTLRQNALRSYRSLFEVNTDAQSHVQYWVDDIDTQTTLMWVFSMLTWCVLSGIGCFFYVRYLKIKSRGLQRGLTTRFIGAIEEDMLVSPTIGLPDPMSPMECSAVDSVEMEERAFLSVIPPPPVEDPDQEVVC